MRLHRIVREANDFAVERVGLEHDAANGCEDAYVIEQFQARFKCFQNAVREGCTMEAQWKRYQRALTTKIYTIG